MTVVASNYARKENDLFPGDSSGTEDHAWYVWTRSNVAHGKPIMLWEARA